MTDLARDARGAVVEPPAQNQPGANARRNLYVHNVLHSAAGTERELGERAEVRVVVDRDMEVDPARQLLGRVQPGPARQDHGGADGTGPAVDRTREPHPGADDLAAIHAGVAQDLGHQLGGGVERGWPRAGLPASRCLTPSVNFVHGLAYLSNRDPDAHGSGASVAPAEIRDRDQPRLGGRGSVLAIEDVTGFRREFGDAHEPAVLG